MRYSKGCYADRFQETGILCGAVQLLLGEGGDHA
jgi:hypothetical protein